MQKIPTLFARNPEDRRHVLNEITPGCEWVLAGEGTATRKYDGTCVLLDEDRRWWARREVKPGKATPPAYRPLSTDETTGKTVGWEPIEQSSFARFHDEALNRPPLGGLHPGTYELIGPKINRNPEGAQHHQLIRHAEASPITVPPALTFESLRDFFVGKLTPLGYEGIVWHHPDGRMAKLKTRDFPQGA
ncbi:hypothetical protein ACZ90_17965 [Streptomyces albus subsp. albus]|nr:hypothetical protein ACZ90_17965 [Streptomyces albus subsp. albus]